MFLCCTSARPTTSPEAAPNFSDLQQHNNTSQLLLCNLVVEFTVLTLSHRAEPQAGPPGRRVQARRYHACPEDVAPGWAVSKSTIITIRSGVDNTALDFCPEDPRKDLILKYATPKRESFGRSPNAGGVCKWRAIQGCRGGIWGHTGHHASKAEQATTHGGCCGGRIAMGQSPTSFPSTPPSVLRLTSALVLSSQAALGRCRWPVFILPSPNCTRSPMQ